METRNDTDKAVGSREAYHHVGETFRYFLDWRHKLFAGYLTVLGALAFAAAWSQPVAVENGGKIVGQSPLQALVEEGLPYVAMALSVVFWMAEFRNRELWRGCQLVGECLEQDLPARRGVYTHLREIEARGATWGISHGSAMDLLTALVIGVSAAHTVDEATLHFPPVLLGFLIFLVSFATIKGLGKEALSRRYVQEDSILRSARKE